MTKRDDVVDIAGARYRLVSQAEFRARARDGSGFENEPIILRVTRADEITRQPGDATRDRTFTISTEDVDRYTDTIKLAGWQLDHFMRNPVVLWMHSYGLQPIGRASKIWKDGGRLRATASFVPADDPANGNFVEGILRKIDGGFLNATSVGFLPKKWKAADDSERPYGVDFLDQELLEFSVVTVPALPQALLDGRSLEEAARKAAEEKAAGAAAVIAARAKARRRRIAMMRLADAI